jgi:GNAT superfamily N-acetyltransferase
MLGGFASHVGSDTEVWVAEDQSDTVVGILVLDGQWLDQLYVEPTRTGHGIGAGLVELAKRERPEGLQLWTFKSNAGARRFYERSPSAGSVRRPPAPRWSRASGRRSGCAWP